MRKLLTVACALALIPAAAQAASLEDLLVEKGVITKSEARASMHGGGAKVYWKGGTRLEFPDNGFTAKINTQLQTRYEFTDNESGGNTSSFRVRRGRIQMSGSALHNEFDYKLQADFVGTSNDGARTPDLRDAWLKWNLCDNSSVQMGQFKAYVSRQENTTSSALQFPDRTEVSDAFTISRAQGARAQWDGDDDRFFLSAAIFNGESDGEGRNRPGVDTNHTGVFAARANLMGEMDPFKEGDIDRTEETAVNAGLAYAFSDVNSDFGGGLGDGDIQRLSADLSVKSDGFSFHGEFFWGEVDSDLVAEKSDPVGFYAQAGMMVSEDTEIAARYGLIDCDVDSGGPAIDSVCAGNDDVTEAGVSLNHYFWGHNLKAQLGYTHLSEDPLAGSSVDTNKVIFQLSAYV